VYYNRIIRVWVFDQVDYFVLSLLMGSIIASRLKEDSSEKLAMERLKSSIIEKSGLVRLKTPVLNSKEAKIKQIYRFALADRGGQLEEFQADHEFSNEVFNLAQNIKGVVERLAVFLKKKELRGVAKIFFKNGRLILELILYKCKIDITYTIIAEGLSTQVIVMTVCAGGAAGFALSWFSVGAILVSPSVLLSFLLLRNVNKQILNQRDYSKFKKMVDKMLDNDEMKKTIQAAFVMEGEGPTSSFGPLKMEPLDFDEKSALKNFFNLKPDENLDEFIKARMKEELGLIENPTEEQLQEIVQKMVKRKPKRKTVFFRDFINENPYEGSNFSHSDIIDDDILEQPIRMKSDNEL
jgi:hypothetical protein